MKKYQCKYPNCSCSFTQLDNLKKHITTIEHKISLQEYSEHFDASYLSLKCNICNDLFSSNKGLFGHLSKKHHISREEYAQMFETEEWISCSCGKKFYCSTIGQNKCKAAGYLPSCSRKCSNKIPWNKGTKGLQIAWNKSLTKDTDERVAKLAEHCGHPKSKPGWNKGLTKETDERIKSPWNKGLTKETDKRVKPSWNKGLTKNIDERVAEAASNISKTMKIVCNTLEAIEKNRERNSGSNNVNYIDGSSMNGGTKYGCDFSKKLKEKIRTRDKHRCVLCGKTQRDYILSHYLEDKLIYRLSVHHIDYNKLNNSDENLITLCSSCHQKTNLPNRRDAWTAVLQMIQESC